MTVPADLPPIDDLARAGTAALLGRIAETDPLTGLANRRCVLRQLRDRVATAARDGAGGVVIFCDLEGLPAIEERFGPAASDEAVRLAAEAIRGAVRVVDAVGRIDATTFAVLMGRVAVDQALAIAARVSTAVRGRRLTSDGVTVPIAASVGIAAYTGAEDADALLARAARPTGAEV